MNDWKVVHKEICHGLKKKGNKTKKINSLKRKKLAEETTDKYKKNFEDDYMELMKTLVN